MNTRIVIVGFGSIGQGIAPLLRDAFPRYECIALDLSVTDRKRRVARACNVDLQEHHVTPANHRALLTSRLRPGDILLNLATNVGSLDLIAVAHAMQALYLDTNIEPWPDSTGAPTLTGNYALREAMLAMKRRTMGQTTAVVAHGANPGFVSVLVKQALLEMARSAGFPADRCDAPASRQEWARLAADLGIRVIQIAERDTQHAPLTRADREFVNTWSVPGFVTECLQDAELGWGTHEIRLPEGALRHDGGCRAAITVASPGHRTRVMSWSPRGGECEALLLTHNESISLADYLTLSEAGRPAYRPTVYYAYRPTDLAVASLALLDRPNEPFRARVLKDEIEGGEDVLGVLLMSASHPSFWLGSTLSVQRARTLAPFNNATSLQVASSIVAALRWAIEHPRAGIVESEDIDHVALYAATAPYWEPIERYRPAWPAAVDGKASLLFGAFQVATGSSEGVARPSGTAPRASHRLRP